MAKATLDQYLQLGQMVSKGNVPRELMQALLEGRIEITPKPVPKKPRAKSSECFKPIEAYKNVTPKDDMRLFEVVELNQAATPEEAIVALEREWLRPALYEELCVYEANRNKQMRWQDVIALGSTGYDDSYGVMYPALCDVGGKIQIEHLSNDVVEGNNISLLAVRKPALLRE